MEERTYWVSNGKRAYDIKANSHIQALQKAFNIQAESLKPQGPAFWDYVSQTDDGQHFQYWIAKP